MQRHVVNSLPFENPGDGLVREVWRIVFLREVGEEDVFRAVLHAGNSPGGVGVGEVAAIRQYAALERPGVAAIFEDGRVVVRFEDEDVGAVDGGFDGLGDEAEVRADSNGAAARETPADGIGGIVRGGKWRDGKACKAEGTIDGVQERGDGGLLDGNRQARKRPQAAVNREMIPFGERREAGDVVAVLVRQEDGIEVSGVDVLGGERLLDARGADADIDEDFRAIDGDERRVALAAAREDGNLQMKHLLSFLFYLSSKEWKKGEEPASQPRASSRLHTSHP